MHGEHGDPRVQGVDVPLGHEHGHGAAAAGIHLAQLGHLPDHAVFIQHLPHIGHQLGGGVGGPGLAPGAGVLAQAHAAVYQGAVALLVHVGEVGVVGRRHVGGQAEGLFIAGPHRHVLGLTQVLHKSVEGGGLHAGDPLGADLLLVGQHANGGALRGAQLQQGGKAGVGAHPIVVAVGPDERAVKADVAGVEGGHRGQLGGNKILLHNAVLPVQQLQNGQLHPVLALVVQQGPAAHQDVQALGGNGLPQGFPGLLHPQVGQKVVDGEQGVPRPVADGHPDHLAVFQGHHPVELQGDGHPLVLPQAAVVVGLQKGQIVRLIEGVLLQIQAGGVDVGGPDVHALLQALPAHHRQHDGLAPVHPVHLVPGLQIHAPLVLPEAGGLRQGHSPVHALPLGLARVQKLLVAGAVGLHGLQLLPVHPVIAVFLVIAQGLPQLIAPALFLVLHGSDLLVRK